MSLVLRHLWPVLLYALAILTPSAGSIATEAEEFDLRKSVNSLVAAGAPGALALLRVTDSSTFVHAGVADRRSSRPFARSDVWRIASVTKLATAAIVMQLVEEGRLRLSDRLDGHLTGLAPRASRLTVEQLLEHSSGVPEYLTLGNEILSSRAVIRLLSRRPPQAKLVDGALSSPWRRPRTADHEYSNTNYVLLERLIEKIESKPFRSVMESRVITRLGLTSTGFPDMAGGIDRQHVRTYLPSDGKRGPMTDYSRLTDVTIHPYALGGDGGLYATVDDIAHLLDALLTGQLVGESARRRMLAKPRQDHDGRYRYGLGIMVVDLPCGKRILGHEGRDLGAMTLAYADPVTGRMLVLMINTIADGSPRLEDALVEIQTEAFCSKRVVMPPARDS